jgi:hypothetical protein
VYGDRPSIVVNCGDLPDSASLGDLATVRDMASHGDFSKARSSPCDGLGRCGWRHHGLVGRAEVASFHELAEGRALAFSARLRNVTALSAQDSTTFVVRHFTIEVNQRLRVNFFALAARAHLHQIDGVAALRHDLERAFRRPLIRRVPSNCLGESGVAKHHDVSFCGETRGPHTIDQLRTPLSLLSFVLQHDGADLAESFELCSRNLGDGLH